MEDKLFGTVNLAPLSSRTSSASTNSQRPRNNQKSQEPHPHLVAAGHLKDQTTFLTMGARRDAPKNQADLPNVDKAKVAKIVEVCTVSVEEATLALDACHMDLYMAINRCLSGAGSNSWVHVQNKLPSGQRRGGRPQDGNRPFSSEGHTGGNSRRHHHSNGPGAGASGGEPRGRNNVPKRPATHGAPSAKPYNGRAAPTHEGSSPVVHRPPQEPVIQLTTDVDWNNVQRTPAPRTQRLARSLEKVKIDEPVVASNGAEEKPPHAEEPRNYAAAAATGLRPVQKRTEKTGTGDSGDGTKKLNPGGVKPRGRTDPPLAHIQTAGDTPQEVANNPTTTTDPSVSGTNPWAVGSARSNFPVVDSHTPAPGNIEADDRTDAIVANSQSPIVANKNVPEKFATKSHLIQFGSFAINGLDAAFSAPNKTEKSPTSTPTTAAAAVPRVPVAPGGIGALGNTNAAIGTTTVSTAQQTLPPAPNADGVPPAMPRPPVALSRMPSSSAQPVSSEAIGNGSGMNPVMPPPYPYNVIPSYSLENGSDRHPFSSSGLQAGAGLGDTSLLSESAKNMLGGRIGESDKGNTTGAGLLPRAMDPLTAPGYTLPPYVVHPIYGFLPPGMPPPASPYGMGLHGHSHFGQVSSQGGFGGYAGPTDNINKFPNANNGGLAGFGFNDGSSGLGGAAGGNSSGLDSVYSSGVYTPMTEKSSPYNNTRSSVQSGLHGAPPAAGFSAPPQVGGMAYMPANPVHNGSFENANVGPGGWNTRQHGNGQLDGSIGNQTPANNVLARGGGNNGIYAPTQPQYWANGAPGYY